MPSGSPSSSAIFRNVSGKMLVIVCLETFVRNHVNLRWIVTAKKVTSPTFCSTYVLSLQTVGDVTLINVFLIVLLLLTLRLKNITVKVRQKVATAYL